ncbi:hypothetical protein DEO72_LG5g3246 [Vigna unguiculata]|uniref:Uncharacterized protein n=1 Tax=Vigna unguiculata TaxID=3917 RepID=A0A4D6M339_VIGUN|nr:hypothetical protein DEO72_LG5g3246 [Vigna unguiculata]
MLALVVDTSAHPRAAHPRAMCYKCYNGSIFPHHKASPPFRLGKDTKQEQEQRGISLRRDPSRLGELSARSKLKSWPPGRPWAKKAWVTLRQTRLGESDSPGKGLREALTLDHKAQQLERWTGKMEQKTKLRLSGLVRDEEANPSRTLLAAEGNDYVSVKECK